MMDLRQRDNDVRRFVRDLEEWLIKTWPPSTCAANGAKAASAFG